MSCYKLIWTSNASMYFHISGFSGFIFINLYKKEIISMRKFFWSQSSLLVMISRLLLLNKASLCNFIFIYLF